MKRQDFYEGKAFDAYTYFGAHPQNAGVIFRTYAPQAQSICVIGEWNHWQEEPMSQDAQSGIWELYCRDAEVNQMYKYVIYGANGRVEHCDPYGFGMELRPNYASIIRDIDALSFTDASWMNQRSRNFDQPMNIYEMHLGSWKTNDQDENGWFCYDAIANDLIAYCIENHFTHVEFMPLSEYPFDGSWGYQTTGYFSPTSRYGSAKQLQTLVNALHNAGIGAIIDFVPAHFATDPYGLKLYDGSQLYEYPTSDVGESEWGTCNFIYSRYEVRSFLQSAANYWLDMYHFDGIRMDAVSRLIYWMGDENRGVNPKAIEFLQQMNAGLHALHPSAMLIAEDSTAYPNVTKPVNEGGLEFDYKWDLGWMNDTLDYMMKTSDERKELSSKLTFSMYYFYKERYLLPLSHDEVVHGKRTIVDKIYGSYEEKFAQLRSLYLYMMMHPGKKLNFMGNEIAMFREWDETKALDWFLLKYPMHDTFHDFFKALGTIYQSTPQLYEWDDDPRSFEWITINEKETNVYGFKRSAGTLKPVAAFFNFSNQTQTLHTEDKWVLTLHTDWERFNGSTKEPEEKKSTDHFILPPFSSIYVVME
ncbi:MAG: 1,4-alpha-glucan branching protein GlgB [Absicoccus sp.]|uniref:1,4-alpha-glucan branching protein GlgB n=1 Tax=Absicoccus sp. TaxID=2718527 RepID=UPI002A758CBE|nr:1,4-alpha-glucan branching protein GlgB [Absicoccus sp.]MDY3036108.1 1,4-alpha-glucan branching protein GlgB [Absicoccus sp.]